MATRKAIVMVNGRFQQLQAADSLSGTTDADIITITNDESGAIVFGAPVYAFADDHVKKAKANAIGTAEVIGLVKDASIGASGTGSIQCGGIMAGATADWDAVTGDTGGLTFNAPYYLDAATAGKLTKTATSTTGQLVTRVGVAISTTEMKIEIDGPVLL